MNCSIFLKKTQAINKLEKQKIPISFCYQVWLSSLGLHKNGPFHIQTWMKEGVEVYPLNADLFATDELRDGARAHRSIMYPLMTPLDPNTSDPITT